jgi:hypothetical protein
MAIPIHRSLRERTGAPHTPPFLRAPYGPGPLTSFEHTCTVFFFDFWFLLGFSMFFRFLVCFFLVFAGFVDF